MSSTKDKVIELANEEIQEEQFRKAVEKEKDKQRATKWWHKFVPFKIIVIRR